MESFCTHFPRIMSKVSVTSLALVHVLNLRHLKSASWVPLRGKSVSDILAVDVWLITTTVRFDGGLIGKPRACWSVAYDILSS